jgi:hypothetical protein|tara:strand:- start:510 stop:1808 length:1299 start_codon:yes stop_codon:yes gene_type:complete
MTEQNPYFYSRLSTTPTTQIEDSEDNPHTGLIKALSVGMTGNYAIRAGNEFDITIASASTVTVASGVVFRDGAYQAVNATSSPLTLGTAAANSTYSLIVVDSSNALAIRTTSNTNKVPAYTLEDIPIALVLYTDNQATTEVQFLTTNKMANSVSLGYKDSNAFTEGMTMSADSNRTLLKNKGATRDVRVILGDDNVNAKFEIYQDSDSDGDEGDDELFSVKASSGEIAMKNGALLRNPDANNFTIVENQVNLGGNTLTIGAASQFTVESSSSDMIISNTVNDKVIQFSVKDDGGTSRTASFTAVTHDNNIQLKGVEEVIIVALSDETTDLTTGTGKASFHMPFAMTLTKVKASVNTAPTGASIIVDINEAGSTIFSTQSNRPTIAASGTTANAAGINDTALADNALITFDIDQVGSSAKGKGLKVTLYGYRT